MRGDVKVVLNIFELKVVDELSVYSSSTTKTGVDLHIDLLLKTSKEHRLGNPIRTSSGLNFIPIIITEQTGFGGIQISSVLL